MTSKVKIVQHLHGRKMETVAWAVDYDTAVVIVGALHALLKDRGEEFHHFSIVVGDFLRYSSMNPEEMEETKRRPDTH